MLAIIFIYTLLLAGASVTIAFPIALPQESGDDSWDHTPAAAQSTWQDEGASNTGWASADWTPSATWQDSQPTSWKNDDQSTTWKQDDQSTTWKKDDQSTTWEKDDQPTTTWRKDDQTTTWKQDTQSSATKTRETRVKSQATSSARSSRASAEDVSSESQWWGTFSHFTSDPSSRQTSVASGSSANSQITPGASIQSDASRRQTASTTGFPASSQSTASPAVTSTQSWQTVFSVSAASGVSSIASTVSGMLGLTQDPFLFSLPSSQVSSTATLGTQSSVSTDSTITAAPSIMTGSSDPGSNALGDARVHGNAQEPITSSLPSSLASLTATLGTHTDISTAPAITIPPSISASLVSASEIRAGDSLLNEIFSTWLGFVVPFATPQQTDVSVTQTSAVSVVQTAIPSAIPSLPSSAAPSATSAFVTSALQSINSYVGQAPAGVLKLIPAAQSNGTDASKCSKIMSLFAESLQAATTKVSTESTSATGFQILRAASGTYNIGNSTVQLANYNSSLIFQTQGTSADCGAEEGAGEISGRSAIGRRFVGDIIHFQFGIGLPFLGLLGRPRP